MFYIADIINEDYIAEYGEKSHEAVAKGIKGIVAEIVEYMQFVVYLSAINSEIVPVTKNAVIKRQAGQRVYQSREKSEQSEVGYKIGAAIRKSLAEREKVKYVGEHAKSSKKSPHIRRSHFHSYWTGHGEDKQLIIKWVNTVFVNTADAPPSASTVHKVD